MKEAYFKDQTFEKKDYAVEVFAKGRGINNCPIWTCSHCTIPTCGRQASSKK